MINDQYGSDFGDLILQFVAMVISKKIRGCDIVTRKGQQFRVALIDCDAKAGIMKAQEISKRINRQAFGSGQDDEVKIAVTIGIATYDHNMTLPQLREKAFCAMKHGKDAGCRNCVSVYGKSGDYQIVFKPS
ncbi:diguanylate cyclase [Candidatus Falkowbacteria bacterium]|jgi:diguanylate cyclase (GGDEF)-like protein|nr:diguanylate cyclase [Candidatus Falkowbacteria bacterium]MBT5503683.1 diguanylate cyclase [Candidatus Falkowbacteria bacterium]MBT6573837.1 diguanylate cyclase [Candidatus Falkowbacteria bacterium]MBT7348735.1 diguanylate cyclase [Candidatus Falkowbacteria bacterium]MBT7500525.1 diguanylate cyclase [Candidatus Falkowbacteria bacterium]